MSTPQGIAPTACSQASPCRIRSNVCIHKVKIIQTGDKKREVRTVADYLRLCSVLSTMWCGEQIHTNNYLNLSRLEHRSLVAKQVEIRRNSPGGNQKSAQQK